MVGFTKFVHVGRVVLVASGKYRGKLCAVVNVIDQNRVLADGPETGVPRCVINLKNVHITPMRVRIPHTASTAMVRAQWLRRHVSETWQASMWCRKLQAKQRSQTLTDFERFKVQRLKAERRSLIGKEMKALRSEIKSKKKAASKKGGKKIAKKPSAKKAVAAK